MLGISIRDYATALQDQFIIEAFYTLSVEYDILPPTVSLLAIVSVLNS